jgi:release factor glutamine methyltransferase
LKLKEAYQKTRKYLRDIYDANEAMAISRLVFEYLGFSHLDIFTSSNKVLHSKQLKKLEKIQEELALKKPVQYVLGYAWFYERKFNVSPACLIPRQETEELVDLILKENRIFKNILDIGTGSGCIAISLKLARAEARITAMENSPYALSIAKENASIYKKNILFVEDDILYPDYEKYPYDFDLIVSNPPYVRESERVFMNDNVLSYEPGSALFVKDDDPLLFYRAIREFCRKKLAARGFIFLEVNEALASETAALFNSATGYETSILNDIHGKPRFVKSIRHD